MGALPAASRRFPKFYPSDILHERFLPVVLRYMSSGAAALLSAAADAAAAIWHAQRTKPQHRTALYGRLVRDFAQGRSWRHCAVFVDFCGHALRRCSCRLFKVSIVAKHAMQEALPMLKS